METSDKLLVTCTNCGTANPCRASAWATTPSAANASRPCFRASRSTSTRRASTGSSAATACRRGGLLGRLARSVHGHGPRLRARGLRARRRAPASPRSIPSRPVGGGPLRHPFDPDAHPVSRRPRGRARFRAHGRGLALRAGLRARSRPTRRELLTSPRARRLRAARLRARPRPDHRPRLPRRRRSARPSSRGSTRSRSHRPLEEAVEGDATEDATKKTKSSRATPAVRRSRTAWPRSVSSCGRTPGGYGFQRKYAEAEAPQPLVVVAHGGPVAAVGREHPRSTLIGVTLIGVRARFLLAAWGRPSR